MVTTLLTSDLNTNKKSQRRSDLIKKAKKAYDRIHSNSSISPIRRAYELQRIHSQFLALGIKPPQNLQDQIAHYENQDMFCENTVKLSNFASLNDPSKLSFDILREDEYLWRIPFPFDTPNARASRAFIQFYMNQFAWNSKVPRLIPEWKIGRFGKTEVGVPLDTILHSYLPFVGGEGLLEITNSSNNAKFREELEIALNRTHFGYVVRDTMNTHILLNGPEIGFRRKHPLPNALIKPTIMLPQDPWIYTLRKDPITSIESRAIQQYREILTFLNPHGNEPSLLDCIQYGLSANPIAPQRIMLLDNFQSYRGVFTTPQEMFGWVKDNYRKPKL